MNILITNDDGIFAPGIAALVRAFSAAGHTVTVCAPDSQRSAASQALTINRPICVKKVAFEGAAAAFAIGGTPADCVKLGLAKLCPEAEAVISGVNKGFNTGTDILYSGTVGAALEGAINGRLAMAVSRPHTGEDYDSAAQLAAALFAELEKDPIPAGCVLNLNYPAGELRGVKRAEMGYLHYDEVYAPGTLEDGTEAYTLCGVVKEGIAQSEDYALLLEGYATVSVLNFGMTDRVQTQSLKFCE